MNKLEFLSPSEKLTALIDGELKSTEAGNVFYEISQSQDLQDEFFDLINMKSLFNQPVLTPPPALKTAILSTAGISTGAAIIASNSSSGILTAVSSSKLFVVPMTAILASLATYLIMLNLNPQAANFANNAQTQLLQNKPSSVSNIPFVYSNSENEDDKVNKQNNQTEKIRTIIKYVAIERNDEAISTDKLVETNSDVVEANSNSQEIPSESNLIKIDNSSIVNSIFQSNEQNITQAHSEIEFVNLQNPKSEFEIIPTLSSKNYLRDNRETQLSINFRGFSSHSFQNIDVPSVSVPAINNIGIGLMYHFNENLSLGLEFGQENFVQQYKANSGNREFLLKQNYLTFWGGAKTMFVGNNSIILKDIHPFSSVLLGMTNVGPLAKLELGMTYQVTDKFSLYSAGELSSMFSSYNKQWTTSHKYGLSYGMMIKF